MSCSCYAGGQVHWRREKTALSLIMNKHTQLKETVHILLPEPQLPRWETQQETEKIQGLGICWFSMERSGLSLKGKEGKHYLVTQKGLYWVSFNIFSMSLKGWWTQRSSSLKESAWLSRMELVEGNLLEFYFCSCHGQSSN